MGQTNHHVFASSFPPNVCIKKSTSCCFPPFSAVPSLSNSPPPPTNNSPTYAVRSLTVILLSVRFSEAQGDPVLRWVSRLKKCQQLLIGDVLWRGQLRATRDEGARR